CFFFQGEDGIRDFHVTGVQTCALPIFLASKLVRLQDGYNLFDTRRRLELLYLFGRLFADGADHRALDAPRKVDVEAKLPQSPDDLIDDLFGCSRFHDDDHRCASPFIVADAHTSARASIKRWFWSGVPIEMRRAVGAPKELPWR